MPKGSFFRRFFSILLQKSKIQIQGLNLNFQNKYTGKTVNYF